MTAKHKKVFIIIKKLLVYLIVPSVISLIFVWGYFSGELRIQELVAPRINREYGLLENLQNLILLAVIALAVYGLIRKRLVFERVILVCVLIGTLFLLMEEIDYGRLHYHYLIGDPIHDRVRVTEGNGSDWNIHNLGNINQLFEHTLDIGLIVFFIIFPLVTWKSTKHMIRYLRPDPWFILTMVAMLAVSRYSKALNRDGLGLDGALQGNTAEFREIIVYYVFLIYLLTFIFRRRYVPEPEIRQTMKLYYHGTSKNFGDSVNYNIFKDLFNQDITRTRYYKADFIGIGSILTRVLYNPTPHHTWKNLRKLYYSIVLRNQPINILGSGFVEDVRKTYRRLKQFRPVNIIALRGHKSKDIMELILRKKLDDIIIGDPGILSSELIKGEKIEKNYQLGIIPHMADQNSDLLHEFALRSDTCILNIRNPPVEFMRSVAACEAIASTALHGLIAADSLHIPNLWIKLSDKIAGQDFKFYDYYSAYKIKPEITDLRYIPRSEITPEYVLDRYRIDFQDVEDIKSALTVVFNEFFKDKKYN